MPIASPEPSQSSLPWGVALAATSVLLIGGGAIVWAHRESPPDLAAGPGTPPMVRQIPLPIAVDGPLAESAPYPLVAPGAISRVSPGPFSVEYALEHGRRVVKIRVVPDGDELVVDAATGRLIETRPSRPTAPPPVGKFAAPFVPAT
jgi:hypothetical protein